MLSKLPRTRSLFHINHFLSLIYSTINVHINVREYRRATHNGHSRENDNIRYTRRKQTKQKHYTICVGHHYMQTHTNNVNKTCALLQTTAGGIDKANIVCICRNPNNITTRNSERKHP